MSSLQAPPLIGIPADSLLIRELKFHGAGDKYVQALTKVANVLMVIIPTLEDPELVEHTLNRLDGILITGSPTNVHPELYNTAPSAQAEPYDHPRDATSLHIIRTAIKKSMPLLAICRGIQELNVVLGGSLDTEIHKKDNRLDHRQVDHIEPDIRYQPQHDVSLEADGELQKIIKATSTTVNSLHRQAINTLASGLNIEAKAPDGTIEAVSIADAGCFAFGIQWHPEHDAATNPHSRSIFEAFGDAARVYAQNKTRVTM